jgi:hypothetical protein
MEWWLRPVRIAALDGEHRAVVWKLVNLRPRSARRCIVGVRMVVEPYGDVCAKPQSSRTCT